MTEITPEILDLINWYAPVPDEYNLCDNLMQVFPTLDGSIKILSEAGGLCNVVHNERMRIMTASEVIDLLEAKAIQDYKDGKIKISLY